MCGITPLLAIASQVDSFAAESARVNSENEARAANRTAAVADYNRQIEESQRNFIAESRATQQKGFDETLKARSAKAKARAQAATQGAAGLSVEAVLNELTGIAARTQSRIDDEQTVNTLNYENQVDSAYSTVRSRINANRPVSGPSPIGLAINIGSSIAKAQAA